MCVLIRFEPEQIHNRMGKPEAIIFELCPKHESSSQYITKFTSLKKSEIESLKAIALCFKPYLKPEEAMIYCNLGHSQLAKRLQEFGVLKNASGYISRAELDIMMSGKLSHLTQSNDGKRG